MIFSDKEMDFATILLMIKEYRGDSVENYRNEFIRENLIERTRISVKMNTSNLVDSMLEKDNFQASFTSAPNSFLAPIKEQKVSASSLVKKADLVYSPLPPPAPEPQKRVTSPSRMLIYSRNPNWHPQVDLTQVARAPILKAPVVDYVANSRARDNELKIQQAINQIMSNKIIK